MKLVSQPSLLVCGSKDGPAVMGNLRNSLNITCVPFENHLRRPLRMIDWHYGGSVIMKITLRAEVLEAK